MKERDLGKEIDYIQDQLESLRVSAEDMGRALANLSDLLVVGAPRPKLKSPEWKKARDEAAAKAERESGVGFDEESFVQGANWALYHPGEKE